MAVFQSSSRTPSLGDIVRRFGVEPDSIRLIQRRHNTHWRVRAGSDRYVLRRFGAWSFTDGDIDWELAAIEAMAGCGLPVARQLGEPLNIWGATYILMPWLAGRRLAPTPTSEADYRRLGALLAQVHAATQGLEPPGQRPGWGAYVDGALPLAGGATRRAQLLDDLAKVDADMARRFAEAAEALDARNLPAAFAREPRMIVHADFQPWNLRMRRGRLSGLLDFELAHLDVRAADVAMARRGYHDAVVEGYLEHATLSAAELGLLDALWLAAALSGVWRVLEGPEGATGKHRLDWNLEQLGKTKPFRARPARQADIGGRAIGSRHRDAAESAMKARTASKAGSRLEPPMKPPFKRLSDLKPAEPVRTYAPPTPKVSRQTKAKVLSAAERAAFLASRPDLKPKS